MHTSQLGQRAVDSSLRLANYGQRPCIPKNPARLPQIGAQNCMYDNSFKENIVSADLGQAEISLQLPYDRLRTPQERFSLATLRGIDVAWPRRGPVPSRSDEVARIVAACVALFYKYTGQNQIPISVATSISPPGALFHTIAIGVSGRKSLAQLQRDVAAKLIDADVGDDRNRMAPVLISYCGQGSDLRSVPANSEGYSHPDIHLKMTASDDSLSIGIDYDESLFNRDTIERLRRHLASSLARFAADTSTLVGEVSLLSTHERDWITDNCNGLIVEYPQQPVHVEFEICVANDPQKTAVKCGDESHTYEELNRRANQIARMLGVMAVCKGSRVVACLDPSLDVLAALLGILKAGATYVPVNPGHPILRIEAILEDIQPSLVITQSRLTKLFDSVAVEIVCIDQPPDILSEQSFENPNLAISPEQIAYIYYTSGTTGKPKGVMASHANMINFIRASRDRYQISAMDSMPAVASYTFSISIFELMSPLSVGGTLLLLERAHVLDAARMADTLQEVTIFHIGPSLLKNIVKYIKQSHSEYAGFSGVRHASSGGDMVPPELLCDLREIFTQAEIYVIYGCSEISLMGCTWEVLNAPVTRTFVGSPFANVSLLVLDDDGNQVPQGAIGDVCIGGNGVVTGYLNRPELTEQLFFEHKDNRFYRTGDRGRINTAGHLELLGRRDFQIQLRGMRIELGEIDYHLRQETGVRDGIVAAKKWGDGDKVLVAYYVPQEKGSVDIGDLRDHMVRRLPDYMVPTFYVELEELPLNHNMKVDRKALPDYEAPETICENPPQTKTEMRLARIWCDLLHRTTVDVGDNFMALGGDSLHAMQLIFTVEQELDCKLDGLEILRESLAVLARVIDRRTGLAPVGDQPAKTIAKQIIPLSTFYFGPDEGLYGLYQTPLFDSDLAPVLICPPIGYEYNLCQYFLRLLAENLAHAGIPSLRFDFFGSGDSYGGYRDVTIQRWRDDLSAAYDELVHRSGAKSVRVMSYRLNTILAFQALAPKSIDRWVCWDAVTNGQLYWEGMRQMSREKAQKSLVVRNLKLPSKIVGAEEAVGMTLSQTAIDELVRLKLEPGDIPEDADVVQILSADHANNVDLEQQRRLSLGKFPAVVVDDECNWFSTTRTASVITHKSLLDQLHLAISSVH